MERRKFVQSTLAASLLPLGAVAADSQESTTAAEKELYEIRTYEMKFRGNKQLLLDYLKKTLEPALRKLGANHFMLFSELGGSDPQIIRLLISYPNANVYFQAQQLSHDPDFIKAATTYNTHKNDIYTRFSSSLLWAFDGFPKLKNPIDGASLFELRTYEGYNEDAVRRKIKMFNKEEFPVFDEVGLNSVFFGEVIAGPQRPCLIYLLSFKDMEAHDVAWKKFFSHPEWDRMKVLPEYANTVSHIEKVFLKLM